jgi:hypothetical protein
VHCTFLRARAELQYGELQLQNDAAATELLQAFVAYDVDVVPTDKLRLDVVTRIGYLSLLSVAPAVLLQAHNVSATTLANIMSGEVVATNFNLEGTVLELNLAVRSGLFYTAYSRG